MNHPLFRTRVATLFFHCVAACLALLCAAPTQAASPIPTPPSERRHTDFLAPHPPYPLEAKITGYEGDVVVRVTWAVDGLVKEAVVVKSSGTDLLDRPTWKYIKAHWRSYTGKEVTHTVTVRYVLSGMGAR